MPRFDPTLAYGETAERLLSGTILDAAETMSDPPT